MIEGEFGRPMSEIFARFDLQPIASASIAHVHRAALEDGREVAVKIRRPGLERRVDLDLSAMAWLASTMEALPPMRLLAMRSVVDEFGGAIREQLDFRIEAGNNRTFRRNFQDLDGVRIPELVDDLCCSTVLVMEFLEGLGRPESCGLTEQETQDAARLGLRVLYRMIFFDGFIHADMHAANVFFLRGPCFVMLDFGLVARLVGPTHKDFVDFFYFMVTNDGAGCAEILLRTALSSPPAFQRQAFETTIVDLVKRHWKLDARRFEITRFVAGLFAAQRKHGIRGSTEFMMTILSLLFYEGLVKQVYPDMDFQEEARRILPTARARLLPPRPWGPEMYRVRPAGAGR